MTNKKEKVIWPIIPKIAIHPKSSGLKAELLLLEPLQPCHIKNYICYEVLYNETSFEIGQHGEMAKEYFHSLKKASETNLKKYLGNDWTFAKVEKLIKKYIKDCNYNNDYKLVAKIIQKDSYVMRKERFNLK